MKTKFLFEGSHRLLPYDTIIVTYDERFIFQWFPSNRGYHSNNTGILFLNKADFLEIYLKTLNPFFYILKCDRLASGRRKFKKKAVRRFYRKTRTNFLRIYYSIPLNLLENLSIN